MEYKIIHVSIAQCGSHSLVGCLLKRSRELLGIDVALKDIDAQEICFWVEKMGNNPWHPIDLLEDVRFIQDNLPGKKIRLFFQKYPDT